MKRLLVSQSNLIVGAIFFAFIVYITMKGELPTYMGFFVPNPNAADVASTTGPRSTSANPGLLGQTKPLLDLGPLGTFDPQIKGGILGWMFGNTGTTK